MRVLVTGGQGFVGSVLVPVLAQAGHTVRVLDVRAPAARPGPGVSASVGDVRDRETCARALRGVDAVVHLAAVVGTGTGLEDLPDFVGVNDLGTAVLLAAAHRAGVRRVVLASSMVVYGEGGYACAAHGQVRPGPRSAAHLAARRFDPPCPVCGSELDRRLVHEDAPLEPRSVYAATKVAQENLVTVWAHACGGQGVLVRWAVVGTDAVADVAARSGLTVLAVRQVARRWVAVLRKG